MMAKNKRENWLKEHQFEKTLKKNGPKWKLSSGASDWTSQGDYWASALDFDCYDQLGKLI